MPDIPLHEIIQSSPFSYSYCKVIQNTEGKPVDYLYLDVNNTFLKMTGHSREEVVDHRITEIAPMPEQEDGNWIELFGTITLKGETREFEKYSRPLDRWFHMSVSVPRPGHFCVLSFDITEKYKTKLNLAVSEERYRHYIENAPDGIFINDAEGKYLQVNPAGAKMLGYTEDEMKNLSISDVVPPESRERVKKAFNLFKKTGKSNAKTTLLKKNGERIIVMFSMIILPEGQYIAFCKDITEQENIALSKERYVTAVQAMAQPVIVTSADGHILEINKAFTTMYGYTREESIGKDPNILNPGKELYRNLGYSGADYDSLFEGLWKKARNPDLGTWEGIIINRKKNGKLVWVNLVINSIFDDHGNVLSIIGLPIDITNSHELENKQRILLYRTIAELSELRDEETGNHMKRVGIFARLLAKAAGRHKKFCSDIAIFAPLHDIGKVGILDSILLAQRSLTDEEFSIMKGHTTLGYNIVRGKKGFEMAAEITHYHHECYDGSGYPDALQGNEIPLAAQITKIVDVYDALRSKRPYKEPWTHEKAVKYIESHAGIQFDPKLTGIFSTIQENFAIVFSALKD